VPKSCEEIWGNVLSGIERHVSPATYNLWFRNTTLLSVDGECCTIGVPNSYTAIWLKKHFSSVIKDILNASLDREIDIGFSVVKQMPSNKIGECIVNKEVRKEEAGDKRHSAPPRRVEHRVMRLEEFVVGPSNQLAYMSAQEMFRSPDPPFSTLFIYGSVGLGKTHILQGICNQVNENRNLRKAIYMPAEHWTNEFIAALKKGKVDSFRNEYRGADVLLIDDVHFLSNKSGIQEEFLHTFNTLHHSSKRIILASDAHPKLIKKIKESLASRMMSGMVAEIRPPDFETALAILKAKTGVAGKVMPQEVLAYMAERLKERSVREFESVLTTVTAIATAYKRKINVSLVKEVLSGVSSQRLRKVRIEDIEKCVSDYFQLSPEELRSSNKKRSQILPIHMCCYLARTLTAASYQEIGDHFGNRRHTTCIAAMRKIKRRLETDSEFSCLVDRLSEEIRRNPS